MGRGVRVSWDQRRSDWAAAAKSELGQVTIVVTLALPVLLGFGALVVDIGNAYVQKRTMQQAADAAALAAAQELVPVVGGCLPGCEPTVRAGVADRAGQYSAGNGGPNPLPACVSPSDPDPCYTWPYNGHDLLVEVRLKKSAGGFFGSILGFSAGFLKTKARAVAAATGTTAHHCEFTPPVVDPDQYLPSCVIPGTSPPPGTYTPPGSPSCEFTPPVVNPTSISPVA